MSQLLPCLSAETEMAAITNSSDSCHEAELDASCCQTITFRADLWKRGDCCYDCSCTYRQTHLSLVTVTWLIKISYVAMTVAYFFLIRNRAGREGGKRTTGCSAGEEGLTQLMCYPSPSLPPIFLCTTVLSSCLSSSDVR